MSAIERPDPPNARGEHEPILEVAGLVLHFGGVAALDGTTFDVAPGSITALIGPNGAGKTTAFNVISGFYRAEAGEIRFQDERIDGKPPHRIVRRGLVRTFQITKALRRMTVFENMLLAAPAQPGEHLWGLLVAPWAARRREDEVRVKARELLRLISLDHLAGAYAGTLSGGQRKLLEFGRALMVDPEMILLDEPMAGVNPTLGLDLLDHIRRLRDEQGTTILFIEHDMEVVMTVAERVIVMNEGRIICDGRPEEVRTDERVIDAYLGAHAEDVP